MNKQPEVKMQTRNNLMEAFWQLYVEKRIDKITVKDITAKAGYNRGTFYEYFSDVYEVLNQIEASLLPDLIQHRDLISNADTYLTLEYLIEVYSRNKAYFVILLGENGDPAFQEKLKSVYKAFIRPRLHSLGADQFVLECMLEYVTSACMGVLTYCFTQQEDPDTPKLKELLWSIMNDWHDPIIKRMLS